MHGAKLWHSLQNSDENTLKQILQNTKSSGLLLEKGFKNYIMICPPITVTKNEVDKGLQILVQVCLEKRTYKYNVLVHYFDDNLI